MGEPNTTESPEDTGLIRNEKGQFVPGVSGNPAGKPPGAYSLVAILKRQLQEIPEGRQKSYGEELIKAMLHKGIVEKDSTTHRLIMNYMEGMPLQRTDVTSKGDKIIVIPPELIQKNATDPEPSDNSEGHPQV